jgi:hypothetical protein
MPARPKAESASRSGPWTALIAERMPRDAAQRVRIGRKLRQSGAIAVRDGVYALPDSPESRTALEEVGRALERERGSALACRVDWLDPKAEAALEERFARELERKRRAALAQIERLERLLHGQARAGASQRQTASARLARLRKRLDHPTHLVGAAAPRPGQPGAPPAPARAEPATVARVSRPREAADAYRGRVWATRRGVLVDRMASAWLILRFVDPEARFRFVSPGGSTSRDELRFDMAEAEFTHQGDGCTFETLVASFQPGDSALRQLAEIVHDLDIKDGKFGRPEAPGIALLIAGLAAIEPEDLSRIQRSQAIFECLYASLGRGPSPQFPKGVVP